ncbi:hypothetical protein V6N13_032973 [Hibiscus sabdariffa]
MVQVHGNACLESVVVMRTLDRKLHAFDVLSEYDGAKGNCDRTIAAQKRPVSMSQPVSQPKPQDFEVLFLRNSYVFDMIFPILLQVHGNVCPESVVVTQTLDRKLHAFDVLSEYDGANGTATGPFSGSFLLTSSMDSQGCFVFLFVKTACGYLFSQASYFSRAASNCVEEEKDSDKDGWDDIEPLEQPKPSPAVANIQSAQKHPMSQPVSQPKPQATSLRPKSTVKVAKVEDNDL